jgi:EpsI family protein
VQVLYYRDGAAGKLISSTNRITGTRSGWHETAVALSMEKIQGRDLAVRETAVAGPGGRFIVWQWYAIGGRVTASEYVGKLLQSKQKFLTGSGDGAVLMVFTPYEDAPAAARPALRAFLREHLAALDATLAHNERR